MIYKVQRSPAGSTKRTLLKKTDKLSFNDKSGTAGTKYTYWLQACNSLGKRCGNLGKNGGYR